MPAPASRTRLVLALLAFFAFMVLLLVALGGLLGSIGPVELAIWFLLVVAGSGLIWRRHRAARA
jgi:hypothetical protein